MSKISLSGNSLGTGTFTIASPNGNTDRTINLPDSNGTILTTATPGVPVNGPAFSAYQSTAQAMTGTVTTKVNFQTKEFDTNTNFDTALSRFTPTVAGYYMANGGVQYPTTGTRCQVSIFKNGAVYKSGANIGTCDGNSVSAQVFLNGSTDYIELYAYVGVSQNLTAALSSTFFQAVLVRSAT